MQSANKLAFFFSFIFSTDFLWSFKEFVELILFFCPDANDRPKNQAPYQTVFFPLSQSDVVLLLPLLLYSEYCSILFTSNIRQHIWQAE